MSQLRPECGRAAPGTPCPINGTAYLICYNAVKASRVMAEKMSRSAQCATYLRQLNHMRESLITQHAREGAQDEKLTLAIDGIATVILALGGVVSEVVGYDCAV